MKIHSIIFMVFGAVFGGNLYGQAIRLDSNSRIFKEFMVWQKQEKMLERRVLKQVRKTLWKDIMKDKISFDRVKLTKDQKKIMRNRKKLKVFLFPVGKVEKLPDGRKVMHILDHDYLYGILFFDSAMAGDVSNGHHLKICFDSTSMWAKLPIYVNVYPPKVDKFIRPVKINSLRFELCNVRPYQFFLDENGYLLDYIKQEDLRVQPENNYNFLMEFVRDTY